MNWFPALILALFVGASLGRHVRQAPDGSELSKLSPVKYFITGQKDANGHWTEQVKVEHGDEDWHIEVDHVTLEVGDEQPKVKISATFSAKSKTPGVTTEEPEDTPEPVESEQQVFQLFPRSHRNWFGAQAECVEWGGHLAIPDTSAKMRKLTTILRKHVEDIGVTTGAFLGFNDQKREGQFVTVFGKPLFTSQDSTWSPHWYRSDQPDDDKSWTEAGEDCGSFMPNGGLNDIPCQYNLPFICEKAVVAEETVNLVAPKDKDDDTLHLFSPSSKDWFEARKACIDLGGHLALPDSEAKMLKMTEMLKSPINNPGHVSAFVGFNDINEEGQFVTIFGKPVFSSGASWSPNWFSPTQPDDDKSWSRQGEDCGAVHPTGGLNDVPCRYHLPYFCELTPKKDADTTHTSLENLLDFEEQSGDEHTMQEDSGKTQTFLQNVLEVQSSGEVEISPQLDSLKLFNRNDFNWFEANGACQDWGGHLATPDSAEKMEVMTLKMKQANVPQAFLGFGDQNKEGYFVTIFAKPVFNELGWSPKWWRDDQPDDDKSWFDDGEDCGSVTSGGGLNDVPCRYRMPFFCESSLPQDTMTDVQLLEAFLSEHMVAAMNLRTLDDCQIVFPKSGKESSSEEAQLQKIIAVQNLPTLDDSQIVFPKSVEESSSEEAQLQIINAVQNLPSLDDSQIVFPKSVEESSSEEAQLQKIIAVQNLPTLDDSQIVFQNRGEEYSSEEAQLQNIINAVQNLPTLHDSQIVFQKRGEEYSLEEAQLQNIINAVQNLPTLHDSQIAFQKRGEEYSSEEAQSQNIINAVQNLPTLDDSQIVFPKRGEESSSEAQMKNIINAVQNLPTLDDSQIVFQKRGEEYSSEEAHLQNIINAVQNLPTLHDSQIVFQKSGKESSSKEK